MLKHQQALQAFRDHLDPECRAQGSSVTNLCLPESDVDVVASKSLNVIHNGAISNQDFTVLEYIRKAKVPRLCLVHKATGVNVDVVFGQNAQEKDKKLAIIATFPLLRDYILEVKKWVKRNSGGMPPRRGYLNSFNMVLIALFCLQNRFPEKILPLWGDVEHNSIKRLLDCQPTNISFHSLFLEFLLFLRDKASKVYIDLRKSDDTTVFRFTVIDPCDGRNVADFRHSQGDTIKLYARTELARHGL
eukprot:Lithocolla_globosa_v1_NODE_2217_length_2099_cov_21.718049.p1 type:complete len:246 gc:universal NODE_2217_length_2099_cov_21.718049:960-223(-)